MKFVNAIVKIMTNFTRLAFRTCNKKKCLNADTFSSYPVHSIISNLFLFFSAHLNHWKLSKRNFTLRENERNLLWMLRILHRFRGALFFCCFSTVPMNGQSSGKRIDCSCIRLNFFFYQESNDNIPFRPVVDQITHSLPLMAFLKKREKWYNVIQREYGLKIDTYFPVCKCRVYFSLQSRLISQTRNLFKEYIWEKNL